jgi:hypothetical protein
MSGALQHPQSGRIVLMSGALQHPQSGRIVLHLFRVP